MTNPYILIGVLIVLVSIAVFLKAKLEGGEESEKKVYQYKKKDFFMTRAEHECYNAITEAVGNEYLIFAQVRLPTLVDNKIVGQNWRAAFSHINGKSVDFVLCDKAYIAPRLVIELDDKTHEHLDRQERDVEVERILKAAELPLLRLENHGHFNVGELSERIRNSIKS